MKKNKNKKSNNKIIYLIVFLLIITTILSSITISKNKLTKDEKYFKREYEKYNNKKDLSGNKYINVNIVENNGVKYLSGKETVDFMKNKTGIIYFGYPQCSWCRSAVEVLLDAKNEMGIDKLYYYNDYGARDEKYLGSDGEILTLRNGSDEYYEILKLLGDKAEVYEGLNDESIKRLYFPTVLFIKNGEIKKMHVSTVESNKSENEKLSNKEYNELKRIYIDGIKKIK